SPTTTTSPRPQIARCTCAMAGSWTGRSRREPQGSARAAAMSVVELVRLALSRIGSSRLRAALTMLGVIIGVASVVALVAVGQGATSGITARLQGLGTNLLTVNPGSSTQGFTRGAAGTATSLTADDANAIAALNGVAAVEPEISSQQLVAAGSLNSTTSIVGTTA